MSERKRMVAVFLVLCISVTLFASVITSGAKSEYDPWVDLDDNGEIDIFDAVILAGAFGSQGTAINKTDLFLDLQARVEELENQLEATWQFVTNFTLVVPEGENVIESPQFFIQGEKWRIRWERGWTISTSGWAGFVICDENGYVIDAFHLAHGVPVIDGRYPAMGVYYVHQGEGNYCIELHNIGADGITFVIESPTI